MKKLFLTLLFIGAFITSVDAQSKPSENSFIKDKISINIGGGVINILCHFIMLMQSLAKHYMD